MRRYLLLFCIIPLLNILQNSGKLLLQVSQSMIHGCISPCLTKCFDKLHTCLTVLFHIRPVNTILYLTKKKSFALLLLLFTCLFLDRIS
jgi:hypothetical protein